MAKRGGDHGGGGDHKRNRGNVPKPSSAFGGAGHAGNSRSSVPAAPGRTIGRIRRFDRSKGFGFLECADGGPDVFFLPSALPKDMKDSKDNFEGIEMQFEVYVNDEGKPRAKNMSPLPPQQHFAPPPPMPPMPPMGGPMGMSPMGPMVPMMGHPMGGMGQMPHPMAMGYHMMGPPPMGPPMGTPMEGAIMYGTIIRYDTGKGFGFIECKALPEDIFFLRSEMPPDLKDEPKDRIMNQYVEFEISRREDGKWRAKRLMVVRPEHAFGAGPVGNMMGPGPEVREGTILVGPIVRYDTQKGFGFIATDGVMPEDVFFLRSELPPEIKDEPKEGVLNQVVEFELSRREDGKWRAKKLTLARAPGNHGPGPDRQDVTEGLHTGVILRFDPLKGYGFLQPDDIAEDVFFLRSEMPAEIREAQSKDDVVQRHVEFEIKTMPDGKLRAMRLEFTQGGEPRDGQSRGSKEARANEPLKPLDEAVVADMTDFLSSHGGSFDYGSFSNKFPRTKKKQLEDHFNIVSGPDGGRGNQRIELKDYEPPPEPEAGEEADPQDDAEMAIPTGPGAQPHGIIERYDPAKGFGFIRVSGFPEEIFFPRNALPADFQGKTSRDMPNGSLIGVQVSFEFNRGEKGPRAERIALLLKWHVDDRCWLLKREADTVME